MRFVKPLFTYTDFQPVTAIDAKLEVEIIELEKRYPGETDGREPTIRANDRMDGGQRFALVEGRASNSLPQRIAQPPRLVVEEGRVVRRRQPLQHLRHGGRQAIVDLIARRPEGVAARLWERVNLQHGVVGGDGLEADVAVPAHGREAARVAELVREAAALLLLLAADHADLVA